MRPHRWRANPAGYIPLSDERHCGQAQDSHRERAPRHHAAAVWVELANNKLSRTFEFQDFVHSLSFVNSLVAYFETVDHHPDVHIAYRGSDLRIDALRLGGKVTDRDVEVAKKISSMYRTRS